MTEWKLKDYTWYKKWYFPSGEMGVQIYKDSYQFPMSGTLYAEISTADDIMELMLVADALSHIVNMGLWTLELPYIPYGRQDRVTAPGTAFSLQVLGCMLDQFGFAAVETWTPHSKVSEDVFITLRTHEPVAELQTILKRMGILTNANLCFIAPDKGAVERVVDMAKALGVKQVYFAEKTRDPSTGQITAYAIEGVPEDSHLVVVDDICDGGRTFVELAKMLPTKRKSLSLFVTHGIFSNGREVLTDAGYDHIFSVFNFLEREILFARNKAA